ncbi:hypothetical protein VNO78_14931 [Psophocarpus tetragonolobus]|uniref:isoflavone 7-O-methyltransferase n=1 Tax=Psophocarpus tetragonolobus TaxID=3891 RepID=A0AAN9SHP1_PSOTE
MASNNGRNSSEIYEGQALLYKHTLGFIDCMCLKWMVELGIPDIIHNHGQPITLSDLVSTLQVPPARVGQVQGLMHHLAHTGFFQRVTIHDNIKDKEAYALTVASELLINGKQICLAPLVKHFLDPTLLGSFHEMKKWIFDKENLTIFDISLGCPLWEFLKKNPAYNNTFNEAMASDSEMMNLALNDCNGFFEGLESIVDVGGGTGVTTKIICQAFSNMKCIVFYLPHVVENLQGSNNFTYVGGDMFKSIPKADAVLLKLTLHNWSDNDCKKILENCREAISSKGKRGKVIVIDVVINEKQDDHEVTGLKHLLNICMACLHNGKERTEEEWKKLFVEAGFQSYKIFPFSGYLSLIEIYP